MNHFGYSSPNWDTLGKTHGENLPHWQCEKAVYHVSFRLLDAVPEHRRHQWENERQTILHTIACQNREPTDYERLRLRNLFSEKIEAYLDAGHGECVLAQTKAAQIVSDSLEFFNGKRYCLHVYCIMPNHTHVLVEMIPGYELAKTVHSWMQFTARKINTLLRRKGSLWQRDSYDHIIRSEREYRRQFEYIWNNPQKMKRGFLRKRFDG